MLQNVVEHADSPTDAVAVAQYYPQDHNVRIAIADSGIGFAQSLRKNPALAAVTDDIVLVRRAVTVEGTTGRSSGRFGGMGLKRLRDICISRHGSVHVTSDGVDAHYTIGNNVERLIPQLDGTTVEIDFRPGPATEPRDDTDDEFF